MASPQFQVPPTFHHFCVTRIHRETIVVRDEGGEPIAMIEFDQSAKRPRFHIYAPRSIIVNRGEKDVREYPGDYRDAT